MLPPEETRTGKFLRRVVPHAIAPTAGLYGIEGVYLDAVVGLTAISRPGVVSTRTIAADVETRGELTRGMSIFDARWAPATRPNIDLAVGVDLTATRQYVAGILAESH